MIEARWPHLRVRPFLLLHAMEEHDYFVSPSKPVDQVLIADQPLLVQLRKPTDDRLRLRGSSVSSCEHRHACSKGLSMLTTAKGLLLTRADAIDDALLLLIEDGVRLVLGPTIHVPDACRRSHSFDRITRSRILMPHPQTRSDRY